ncbi:protoheme IX farnesyltransferase [Paenibacillus sp. SYP-B3998]|uniref:Protoheme IX farnesyltransferase n=1 Tax=Paenibacillus sp. SYP-B3998 TaxID=2678564 RepID=A0A6G4A3R3_9BACL|nr:heme o synthase [Paenibacillus sp. SYP-B3998]NEW08449.1 protoheme IX farnesyltransferase [Paenibacillus sp. SYP-B3998]
MENQISYESASSASPKASELVENSTDSVEPVTLKDFYRLVKPGIIYSNLMTAFAGYWVAAHWQVTWTHLIITMLGIALVMAGGTVLNNYLDREMDAKMERTKNRALPSGRMSANVVLRYGITLGVIGLAVLYFGANSPLAALVGLIGLFLYVWLYTAWFKRTSVWSTFVGAFSGATPPLIGYVAVSGTIDVGGLLLFAFLFLWQPPHFWALGIRRMEEYRAAGFPLLPVVKGSYITKISMIRYIVLLVPVTVMLTAFGYVGYLFLFGSTILGLIWAYMSVKGFQATGEAEVVWAKRIFLYSIIYLTLLSILMVIDTMRIS